MVCSAWIYICASSNMTSTPYCSSAQTPNRNSRDNSTYSAADSVLSAHQNRRLSTQALADEGPATRTLTFQPQELPLHHSSYQEVKEVTSGWR